MTPSPYRTPFISAHGRARVVMILLAVGAIATALSLGAEVLSLAFPPLTDDQEIGDNAIGLAVGLMLLLFAIFELIIYFATVVAFLMWLYRANANLRAFDPDGPIDHSGGWAVGSFFIPFVNLIIPYRAVREVWQKSGPRDEAFLYESTPSWFPIWWLFWLLASFAGNLSLRVSFNENVEQSTATMISIVASALFIVAAVFAYMVVQSIDKRQEESSERLKLGHFFEPPPPPPNLPVTDGVAPV